MTFDQLGVVLFLLLVYLVAILRRMKAYRAHVVEVMGHAAAELAYGFHLLGLAQARLCLNLLGDVLDHAAKALRPAFGVAEHDGRLADVAKFAVGADDHRYSELK